jgi:hypothetical protein
MSVPGQKATFARRRGMSVVPPGADMPLNGRFAPEAAVHAIRLECALADRSASGRGSAGTVLRFTH